MSKWIQHDSNDPPALAPAALIRLKCPEGGKAVLLTVWYVDWLPGVIYSPLTDEDGISYCSAEGIEPWAKYVATDDGGAVIQFGSRPTEARDLAGFWAADHPWSFAPDSYRHPGDWRDSLMRVWRE